jgi:hypothetical protein
MYQWEKKIKKRYRVTANGLKVDTNSNKCYFSGSGNYCEIIDAGSPLEAIRIFYERNKFCVSLTEISCKLIGIVAPASGANY